MSYNDHASYFLPITNGWYILHKQVCIIINFRWQTDIKDEFIARMRLQVTGICMCCRRHRCCCSAAAADDDDDVQ